MRVCGDEKDPCVHLAVSYGSGDAGRLDFRAEHAAETGVAVSDRVAVDAETPPHLDVHLIADNYATHKHAKVKAWLKRHPRFHMHFTPTSGSWLNQVERFFGLITGDRIRCGVFKSVAELEAAIQHYLEHHNADPKPFVWTKSATEILDKVARGRHALESVH